MGAALDPSRLPSPLKLNIGCGNKRLPGFYGVDRFPCEAADHICDVTRGLPFPDSSVDEVLMDNFIEHVLDIPALMQDILRVCRDGALVTVITPHFSAQASWRDLTHVHHLSYFSMDQLEQQSVSHYVGKGYKVVHRQLSFVGGIMGLIARWLFWLNPRRYEKKYCFIFRASTLRFRLRVQKG